MAFSCYEKVERSMTAIHSQSALQRKSGILLSNSLLKLECIATKVTQAKDFLI